MRIVFRPEAQRELREAQAWYEERSPGLGFEFARAVDVWKEEMGSDPYSFYSLEQYDPGPNGKLLRAGLLSHKRLQVLALSVSYGDRGSTKQGHRQYRHSLLESVCYMVLFINGIRISIQRY